MFIGALILLIIISSGCILQDPKSNPSYSVLPALLLDYDSDMDETKMWVKSALSDFKYDNITIKAAFGNQTQVASDNNTYAVSLITQFKQFDLDLLVSSEEKSFSFKSKIDIDPLREDLIIITTYNEITDEPMEDFYQLEDLPYKKILEEVKEE